MGMSLVRNALAGIKVLDLSRILAGPWCTQNLGDLGADVIKVEKPDGGDDTRGWGPPYLRGTQPADGFSAYFLCCNRGKRSIAVDFADPRGADLLRTLAADADVVVENYKAGTLDRYGLGYQTLSALNPRLVYVSVTGFGPTGPLASKPGYDYVFQGMGGLMSCTGPADGSPGAGPLRAGVAVVDLMAGMYATTAVLAALVERTSTGRGQFVDLALLDVAVALNANQGSNYLVSGKAPKRSGNTHPNCAPYEVFACSDEYLILAIGNDAQYERLCAVAGLADLAQDGRFRTNAVRLENMDALRPLLAGVLATRSRRQWSEDFDAVGVPWGPINTLDDVFADPQVLHRRLRIDAIHPNAGTIPMVRNPLVGNREAAEWSPPPAKGEHSQQILAEVGLDSAAITALMDAGVVGTRETRHHSRE